MALKPDDEIKEFNPEHIPQCMKDTKAWITWRTAVLVDKKGKPYLAKIPMLADGKKAEGNYQQQEQGTIEQATATARAGFGGVVGVGFLLNGLHDFVCIDIDNDEGLAEIPEELMKLTELGYAEISVSGKGVHVWIRGTVPDGYKKKVFPEIDGKVHTLEIYSKERFMIMTGDKFNNLPVENRQAELDEILEKYGFKEEKRTPDPQTPRVNDDGEIIAGNGLSKEEVLSVISHSKDNAMFFGMYNGTQMPFDDESSNDQSFFNKLAFYTGKDPQLMREIAFDSKMVRDKWNREDYINRTIDKAIRDTAETFTPRVPQSEWAQELRLNPKTGLIISNSLHNCSLILKNDPVMIDLFALNEMDDYIYLLRDSEELGFKCKDMDGDSVQLQDHHETTMRKYVEIKYNVLFSADNFADVINEIARENSFNPIIDKINATVWDGTPRVETLFIDVVGAQDNIYSREIAKRWLVGTYARLVNNGCKFEIVPILAGQKGVGKSTLCEKIALGFFTDQIQSLNGNNKDDSMKYGSNWIVELSELKAVKKNEIEARKATISAKVDNYRKPYARREAKYKRKCAFIGTTNASDFLKDITGERRFYPIKVKPDRVKLNAWDIQESYVLQLWAEAKILYHAGTPYHIKEKGETEELLSLIKEAHESYSEIDELTDYLSRAIEIEYPEFRVWEQMTEWGKRKYIEEYPQSRNDSEHICWTVGQGRIRVGTTKFSPLKYINETAVLDIVRGVDKFSADKFLPNNVTNRLDVICADWEKKKVSKFNGKYCYTYEGKGKAVRKSALV